MNECIGCIEKGREPRCWVEQPNHVCCDCAFPTPEERQQKMLQLRRLLDRATEELRDRFAQAALTGILAHPSHVEGGAARAYERADEALAHRGEKDA